MKYTTQRTRYKGKNNPNYKSGIYIKLHYCINPNCNNIISIGNYKKGSKRCNKCSRTKENNGNYKDGKTLKIYYCKENCRNKISFYTALYGRGRCRSCSKKGLRNYVARNPNIVRKKNNPNWMGGLTEELYPIEFTEELKNRIRKRDNYKCKICNYKQNGRKLCVHHIDYNKDNINQDNLVSLCNSCHVKTNKKRKYWKEYF